MKTLRQLIGLDWFDLVVHLGVTLAFFGFVVASNGPEELIPLIGGGSLIVLAIRRSRARHHAEHSGLSSGEMAAERLAYLEQRVEELDAAQARIAELEERLDFTERMLAKSGVERRVLGRAEGGVQ